uniref:AA_permease domain-containing protein n=1 Tax=Macrostomum lignano TaxID=282301 RepID=A0A1I8FNY2_9PLAT
MRPVLVGGETAREAASNGELRKSRRQLMKKKIARLNNKGGLPVAKPSWTTKTVRSVAGPKAEEAAASGSASNQTRAMPSALIATTAALPWEPVAKNSGLRATYSGPQSDRTGQPPASASLCAPSPRSSPACANVEFASLVPKAGSSYTYTYCVLGELPAFIVGWTMLLDYILSMATVAKMRRAIAAAELSVAHLAEKFNAQFSQAIRQAFSGTVDSLSKQKISNFVSANLGTLPKAWSIFDETWDLLAVGLILVLALLLIGGAKFSMSVNAGLSTAQLLCLITATRLLPFGGVGVVEGASIAMFAFSGFESVGSAAEECSNPKRDLPRALLASLSAVSVVYVRGLLGPVIRSALLEAQRCCTICGGFPDIREPNGRRSPPRLAPCWPRGATKVTGLFVVPRLMYALASDGVIFGAFANVNERVQVREMERLELLCCGLAFCAVVSSVLALLFQTQAFLAEMVSMGTLVSYCFIGVDLFVAALTCTLGRGLPGDSRGSTEKPGTANGDFSGSMRFQGLARVRLLRSCFSVPAGCVWLATPFIIKSTQALALGAFLAPRQDRLIFSGALLTALKPF